MRFWPRKKKTQEIVERDRVCGMQVDPERATVTHEHQGKMYYFCADRCKAAFAESPAMYLIRPVGSRGDSRRE
jgi:Cu+-exporting ATPase